MAIVTTAQSEKDLRGILALQALNHKSNLTETEIKEEGFVTCIHDLDLINKMNTPVPHTILKDNDEVVGYALVLQKALQEELPILKAMFAEIAASRIGDDTLTSDNYFIMGQCCIAKAYRGKNLFSILYDDLCTRLALHYKYVITEVATENTRSLRAHKKYGFELIKVYQDGPIEWAILKRALH